MRGGADPKYRVGFVEALHIEEDDVEGLQGFVTAIANASYDFVRYYSGPE